MSWILITIETGIIFKGSGCCAGRGGAVPPFRWGHSPIPAAGRRFLLPVSSTTGGIGSAAAAAVHVPAPDGGGDHRPCAADPALHLDGLGGAVEGTGPAFHAFRWLCKPGLLLPL